MPQSQSMVCVFAYRWHKKYGVNSTFSGPKNPSQPQAVQHTNTTHSTATIEWRVPVLTYTPESYYVEYGTSISSLIERSSVIQSGSNLSIVNKIYSVVISGLSSNTTYFYRVVSSNTLTSSRSLLNNFVTVSQRKLKVPQEVELTEQYNYYSYWSLALEVPL